MKIQIVIIGLLLSCASLFAQNVRGDGYIIEEERPVEAFSELIIEGVFNIHLMQGEKEKLVIEAESNILEYIETRQKGDILFIRKTEGVNFKKLKRIDLYITVVDLKLLESSGVGKITCEERLQLNNVEFDIEGVGSTILDVEANKLIVNNSGVGKLIIEGEAQELYLTNSSTGTVDAYGLHTNLLDLDNSSIGSVKIYAEEELAIRSKGIGNVYYRGNPNISKMDVSGIGKVKDDNF